MLSESRINTGENWKEVAFSSDEKTVLVRTVDSLIKRWSLDDKSEELGQAFPHLSNSAKTVAFGRQKGLSLYVEGDKKVNISTPKNSVYVERDSRFDGFVLSPQEDILATYGWSNTVELWRTQSGEALHILDHEESVSTVSFSRDSRLIAVGIIGKGGSGTDRPVYIWRVGLGYVWVTLKRNLNVTQKFLGYV